VSHEITGQQGKGERFSLEMLIILATKAGMRVTLKAVA
jgi:hypothetical protein